MKLFFYLPAVILLFGALPLPAGQIGPVEAVRWEDLESRANLVFKGVCADKIESSLRHAKSGKLLPAVLYRFKIDQVIKGDWHDGEMLEFKQRQGGEVFEEGKRYLLHLSAQGPEGERAVIGGVYGWYELKQEGEKEVLHNPFGVPKQKQP